jgi:hypothetical protein
MIRRRGEIRGMNVAMQCVRRDEAICTLKSLDFTNVL